MFCPKCGKSLDLNEKLFCTGCGTTLKPHETVREVRKGDVNPLPYGARYVSGETEIRALGKGLAIGSVIGLIGGSLIARFVFLCPYGQSFGYGLIGMVPLSLLGLFLISKLNDDSKETLAESLSFIRVEGWLYHIVDILTINLPFLRSNWDGSSRKPQTRSKPRK